MECLLSLEGIHKSFGGVKVLNNVDFRLQKGTIHALVGGNGAGKSTLMKIMTGVYTLDEGTITVNGQVKKVSSPNDMLENGVRMIFQELSLISTLTITENIFLNQELKKGIHLDKREMTQRAKALLDDLEIYVDVNSKIEDLSVGICQLVEIAKALSFNPSVLVMDEPTASLTDREIDVLFQIAKRLKDRGTAIVYISHRMKEIFQIADEITVLRDGHKVAHAPISEIDMPTLVNHIIGSSDNRKSMEWKDREAPVSDEVMLEVENLSLEGRLHNASFKLRKGEVLGLAGLMGSGRTEVMESLVGLNKTPEATIKLEGNKVEFKNVQQAVDSGIVLIPEDRRRQGLVLMHSFKDNLLLPNLKKVKRGIAIDKSKSREASNEAIGKFDIKVNDIFAEINRLSGGNQQKVVIAKWLKTNPKILLMDEPTAGVDIGAKGEIIDIIRNFTAEGKSVIFASSELAELISISDRVLVLSNGRITGELSREEITSEEMLQLAIQK